MSIQMIGTDYNLADVNTRGMFAFTKRGAAEALVQFIRMESVNGCIILSTCNRTEIWIDADNLATSSLYAKLCQIKQVDNSEYSYAFVLRENEEAILHLFYLCSGMRSQILGDDQILTQVKDALAIARESNSTNGVLEVLFRTAISAGKQVKTQVVFPYSNLSAIAVAARQMGEQIQGKRCMVIGNGQMGKLSAETFRDAGAKVMVTVRNYRHGKVDVPDGCEKIVYEQRLDYLKDCDFLVSATSSPHVTMTREQVEASGYRWGIAMIDLAVPRDLDPEIGTLAGIKLYNVDDFQTEAGDCSMQEATVASEEIIHKRIADFYSWCKGQEMASRIHMIKDDMVEDLLLRLTKPIRTLSLPEQEKLQLMKQIEASAGKVMTRLLFGLRENIDSSEFKSVPVRLNKFWSTKSDQNGGTYYGTEQKTAQTAQQ